MKAWILATLAALFMGPASHAQDWWKIKNGDDVLKCFGEKSREIAHPFFKDWTEEPTFNNGEGHFVSSWTDAYYGQSQAVLATGAMPNHLIECQISEATTILWGKTEGIECFTNVSNGIVEIDFLRSLKFGNFNHANTEKVPVIMIKNNVLWCMSGEL